MMGKVKQDTSDSITLEGRKVDYRLIHSKAARKLRVRVGLDGVEVVQPVGRDALEVESFLVANGAWVIDQLKRIERFRAVRVKQRSHGGQILFHGNPTQVSIEVSATRRGSNKVIHEGDSIVIIQSTTSQTSPAKSLEYWLRKQAREAILCQLDDIVQKINRTPRKVYIMEQQTKWGNCSALRNLSFNWRLVLAPDFVLRYIVTHEVVHLAVPDHSQRFWLTVQSHCKDMERAKQWLCANGHKLRIKLDETIPD